MSRLYKRTDSDYFWWTTQYKGRRLRRSTKFSQKHLAKKIQEQWDLKLLLGEYDFLGAGSVPAPLVKEYMQEYLNFIFTRKTEKTYATVSGMLRRFIEYLDEKEVQYLDQITVKILDGYIDWLSVSPKTKKNHLGAISLMLGQAVKEGVLKSNLAKQATLPRITHEARHRMLELIDLMYIRRHAGSWALYFDFLLYTGLRAGDVAMLTYGNINRDDESITSFIRKSRRIHEFPIVEVLLDQLPQDKPDDEPVFPALHAESERRLNDNLRVPREFMQAILKAEGRPKATLQSFRRTFNNLLRDLGLSIEDRQILLAHSSSLTTKIYTNPNFELAKKYVNRLPDLIGQAALENVTKT